jgi:hypothetical protein
MGSAVSSTALNICNASFFAPCGVISPCSLLPPITSNIPIAKNVFVKVLLY